MAFAKFFGKQVVQKQLKWLCMYIQTDDDGYNDSNHNNNHYYYNKTRINSDSIQTSKAVKEVYDV